MGDMMTTRNRRPILAITMGDPAGIGPEIVLKALQDPDIYERCRPVVIGDRRILERACAWMETHLKFEVVTDPADGNYDPGVLTLIDLQNARPEDCPVGEVSAAAGKPHRSTRSRSTWRGSLTLVIPNCSRSAPKPTG